MLLIVYYQLEYRNISDKMDSNNLAVQQKESILRGSQLHVLVR